LLLKPVVARYQGKVSRIYFRADAGFANPDVYEFLEAERIKYAIRLPANQVLQNRIAYLLKRSTRRRGRILVAKTPVGDQEPTVKLYGAPSEGGLARAAAE
jgi:hypothetical protein